MWRDKKHVIQVFNQALDINLRRGVPDNIWVDNNLFY